MGDATPHEWFAWSSAPSELSLRGGVLETEMGQYFQKWLEKEGLFEANAMPTEKEARFYANAKQRTIATTNYFAGAMFPVANIDIEIHADYDKMDEVFTPQLTFASKSYQKAAFGEDLTIEEWKSIARIKDVYQNVLFTAPLIAVNVAHLLLLEIDSEMEHPERKFTFLCGHDSNLGSVLAALNAEPYELPGAIEQTIPIGSKIVFEKWKNPSGEEFVGVELFYQNAEDLRDASMFSTEHHPNIVTTEFEGLEANSDGLYDADAFDEHLHEAIGMCKNDNLCVLWFYICSAS